MKNLYHEIIMDHYRFPRCWGSLPDAQIKTGLDNPSCGDSVEWNAIIVDKRLLEIVFQGKGCVISLATASLIGQWATGKLCADVEAANVDLVHNLLGISIGITRVKCALLPLQALQQGIRMYMRNNALEHKEQTIARSCQISKGASASE